MRGPTSAGLAWAAASGLLFGSVNVAVKLHPLDPLLQSALAYLGASCVFLPLARTFRIARADRPRLLAMAVVGGALSPVLLFYGLRETAAVDAGLLLTLELVVTAILAALFLGERERPRGWFGLALLLMAGLVAAFAGSAAGATTLLGAALVALSACGWGLDNMLSTQLVGTYRPIEVLAVKGMVGGLLVLAIAVARGVAWPGWRDVGIGLLVGAVCLAASLLCFYRALRTVGAARTSAVNIPLTAIAGAIGGHFLLQEPLTPLHGVALLLVLAGVLLLLGPQGSSTSPE